MLNFSANLSNSHGRGAFCFIFSRHFKLTKDEVLLLDSQAAAGDAAASAAPSSGEAPTETDRGFMSLESAILTRVAIQGHERD
jgi:hypothetical protein